MRGAYYVLTALFVVTSSDIAAESDHPLHNFNHHVITAGNAVVKALPNRSLRGSRDGRNDLANEERSISSFLANMIDEGVAKLPLVAEIIKTKPLAAKAVKQKPRAMKKKFRAAKAVEEKSRPAKAAKKTPRAAKAAKKTPPQAKVVDEILYGVEATKEMGKSEEYGVLKAATEGADQALKKHWDPSRETAVIVAPSRDISGNVILSLRKWKVGFNGMRPMVVLDKHKDNIDRVHGAFGTLCDKNMQITPVETSYLWSMLDWNIEKNFKKKHKQTLVRLAQRYVLIGLRQVKKDRKVWNQWKKLPDPLKFGVLNYLLNLHYQRWVRMYNIFRRYRPDQNGVPSTLGGNANINRALALQKHSKVRSVFPYEPFDVAWASKGRRSVLSKRSRRTFDGNTDTASLPSKQLKTRSSESSMPPLIESTTSGDDSVPTKEIKSSFDDPKSAFAPFKPGDDFVHTENSRLSFGGLSSAFVPYRRPNVHNSQSLTSPITVSSMPSLMKSTTSGDGLRPY
uniref:Secreted RxLR effector protein 108 n=1 Tax=Plasmopara viticola TaxID=143451 RepID=RL108_PLAVT|nr:RecName: Full=Secreted RxLR effector protein 108; Flags: Precursor [Plasmopara viticola]